LTQYASTCVLKRKHFSASSANLFETLAKNRLLGPGGNGRGDHIGLKARSMAVRGGTVSETKGNEDSGLVPFQKGDKWGFCDADQNVVIPAVYSSVCEFVEGLAGVRLKKKWGFVDTKGKMVIPPTYYVAGSFSDGLAYVEPKKKWGLWGFIDTKGKMVIDAICDDATSFIEGRAIVQLDGDTKGYVTWWARTELL
jgi:hypothetical protein